LSPNPANNERKRLMIVDDDASIGRALRQVCQDLQFDVKLVQHSAELTVANFEDCDVLLLDLMMPDVDGIEVLRLLGDARNKPALIPMSGLGQRLLHSATQLAQFHNIEVLGELQKPFRPEQVKAMLVQHFARQTMAPAAPIAAGTQPALGLHDVALALAKDQFKVYFQPQVRLGDANWCAVEALARWSHPVHGLVSPDVFMPLIDGSDMALDFAFLILRKAIEGVQVLGQTCQFGGTLSVNISPSALSRVDIPEKLDAILKETGFPKNRLKLEVTETSLPKALKVALDVQTRLAMRGIALSIDDFGTGHSSLERLNDSPFSELKIDLLFVSRIEESAAARSIVKNAIDLGLSLGLTVTAEGVETAGQVQWLKDHHCSVLQGYYICPPCNLQMLQDWAHTRLARMAQDPLYLLPGFKPASPDPAA
jgi:EAL domain-containing protein (putative c-di-GMP-specific phosphodiesterase class I)/CheY-like chemotaxis protein